MEALVIGRNSLPEAIFSFIDAEQIRIEREADRVVLTPVSANVGGEECVDPAVSAIFDGHRFDLTDFKFDRDEANNYG
ncbi:hypothetical protein R80B4_02720 [Fibrobacteres bacterium R8-0-B4]